MANEEQPSPATPEYKVDEKISQVERTVLRPYPKVVFFYLTWIAALACGLITRFAADAENADDRFAVVCTYIFLWVFTFNLLVIAFEFGRMVSVAVLSLVLSLIFLGLWLGFLSDLFTFLTDIDPKADHKFFFFVFAVFSVIFLLVFIQTRFNYWVVRRNELLHKHGFLGDVKRYHAQGLKLHKEIPDVLEFLLLRSGTIVLHPEGESRSIVLENIIGINVKEVEVKQILESYAVRLDTD